MKSEELLQYQKEFEAMRDLLHTPLLEFGFPASGPLSTVKRPLALPKDRERLTACERNYLQQL
jgi:hypothetical protein